MPAKVQGIDPSQPTDFAWVQKSALTVKSKVLTVKSKAMWWMKCRPAAVESKVPTGSGVSNSVGDAGRCPELSNPYNRPFAMQIAPVVAASATLTSNCQRSQRPAVVSGMIRIERIG